MWAIFKINVLSKMLTGEFGGDSDTFAEFYADEYDKCIKRGGDLLNGVNVINGNKIAFENALKTALKKCVESGGENVNILQELYPCFDAYWLGAEMSPIPNPVINPAGWASTIPAPGTIQNLGPNPIAIASSTAANKVKKEALQILEDELKKQIVTIPGIGPVPELSIPVFDTAMKIINNELATPEDEKSKQFYDELRNYFTRSDASKTDRAKWDAFVQLNQEYGYAPVSIRKKTIAGKRSMINPFSGRLNLVMENNPTMGEIKPRAELLLDEYMAEYGHYIQYNRNPDASKLSKTTDFLGDLAGDYGNMIKNTDGLNLKNAYTTNYKTPGTVEYEAHEVIQKKLQSDFDKNVEKSIISNITELTTGQNQMEMESTIRNHPMIKSAIEIIKKLREAKKKKPAIGSQIKKSIKFPFPELPKRKKIIEDTKEQLLEMAIEEIKKQIIPPIEDLILAPIHQYIQAAVEIVDSIPKPKPTIKQIKKFVKDTIDGIKPDIDLPGIEIPNLPKKEDFQAEVDKKTPTVEEIRAMAEDKIKGKIPNPPLFNIVPPNILWSTKTNVMIDPFIMLAQIHLLSSTQGNMMVTSQYTPPAPPAPAILNWSGYQIPMGPPVPDFPTTIKIPEVDLSKIEIPQFPELPELPTLSTVDIVSSLAVSLPNLPIPTIKTPNVNPPPLPLRG
jgi:hypothetical protein